MAIGQTALGDFEDLVRDRACVVEDVETRGVGRVLASEGLAVLFFARGGRPEPGFLAIAVVQPVRGADEPVADAAELMPFLDGRPGLGFELDEGVGGNCAPGIGPRGHQPEH